MDGNDDILHLLAGDRVALFIPPSQSRRVCVPVGEDIFWAAFQRALQVDGGGFVGLAVLIPFLFDGAEELTSVVVGGDDWIVSESVMNLAVRG